MVSDMITHRDSAMKDRLSGKSSSVSQTPPHRSGIVQCENVAEDQAERTQNQGQAKSVSKEDPMSHRIIEKRRRDRMNNCLADLSRLIPAEYMKKGRGRVEKTEIIEMAIKHIKYLQSNVPGSSVGYPPCSTKEPEKLAETERTPEQTAKTILIEEQYKQGFFECMAETMQFLIENHGYPPSHGLCLSLINHLQNYCARIVKGKQVINDVVKDEFVLELNRFNTNVLMNLSANSGAETTVKVESGQQQQNSPINSKSQSSVSTSNEQTLADQCSISFTSDSYSSANSSMYKFKTDIKQRFSAESSGTDSTDYYAPADKKRRRRETSTPTDCGAEDQQDVPIFALHANRSYYIPLTVNRDVISPMLDSVLQTDDDRSSPVIVHPISISVNFQAAHHLHHRHQF